ncbi:TonB-dependent receptor plug domain-containing protein [Stenotrophomonas acidaminiphila]|uniref:TonB-dependent receptor plug domain-containing protein n=1 Tax=Stenotrophomonas acidaminiphila TaxID=128780 RepID=UPI0028A93335|nr:TonB-dependent receptor plug domain-containing protein [Stenotrophomonas acidaminiphila]
MRRLPSPLRVSLLAAALAATPLSPFVPAAAAQSGTNAELPAGPLGRSLAAFASQRGIALAYQPALTTGLQAPALRGPVGDREGLERLLAGSGLRLIALSDGSYTLEKAPAGNGTIALAPLRIGAQRAFPYSEGAVLDQAYIQDTNKGNGDLATLLRINPAVQSGETARSSRNGGEIRPADISINGAPFYQNAFLLDGVSVNNDIDPANAFTSVADVNNINDVPSQSQGIAIDTDMLESVTVYDSNVPASFGNFTGGVVDAQTRKAGDALHGKVWLRMARSAWDEVIIPRGQETTWDQSATFAYQPSYDKYKFGVRLEGRTAAGIGMVGTLTRTRSDIPLRGYSAGNASTTDANSKTQTRENTAATLNVDWSNGEGLTLGANLVHAPTDDRYFIMNARDAWFDIKQGGPVLSLRANLDRAAWSFNNTLSYSDLESSRRSQVDYWKAWARSDAHDWGVNNSSFEGSWGNIDQHDRKTGYRFEANRAAFDWGASRHTLQFGASYQQRKADYERLNDHFSYLQPYATTRCALSNGSVDSDGCSLSPVQASTGTVAAPILVAGQGQYFRRLTTYHAGRFSVSGNEWAGWVQDDIRMGNWSVRPGLRVEDDNIWNRTTLSPRLATSWDILGNRESVLTAGVNRYYGRNFFSYLLREGRERLTEIKLRTSSSTSWDSVTGTLATSTNRISEVDIPHTDEWTLGFDQHWKGWDVSLKYVNRDNKDEVLRQSVRSGDASGYYSTSVYQYVNKGRSRSSIHTLSAAPAQTLDWGRSHTRLQFAFDYTDTKRNYTDYQTSWSDASDERVLYKGEAVWLYDLPARDFARKWTARLSTQTRLPLGHGELLWSNFLRYRAGFRDIVRDGSGDYNGESLDAYVDRDYPRAFTFDSTFEYTLELPREQQAYARVEVANILNRANKISGTTSSSMYYEAGRSFWLELGYRF